MGEKIRDVSNITLAKNNLTIELNEGYTKKQGKVIHIQNNEFRYLLSINEFVLASSLIMRGATELEYVKTRRNYSLPATKLDNWAISDTSFFNLLKASKIDYCVLDLKPNLVTLIISPSFFDEFHHLVKKKRIKKIHHPEGDRFGFTFLYQMHPFELYSFNGCFYEVYFEIPAYSLTPKMWMPLDKKIQAWLWDNLNRSASIVEAPAIIKSIFYLVRCIFYYRNFLAIYIMYFEKNEEILNSTIFSELLRYVFFGFSDVLIYKIKNKEFDNLVNEYFKYSNY